MRIEIATNYYGRLSAWHVRKALRWIDHNDLDGLECIRLMDYEPQDHDASRQVPYLRGFLYVGRYIRSTRDQPSTINLYTHDLYYGIPRLLTASPLATLEIASTLAHEVAHHVGSRDDVSERAKRRTRSHRGVVNQKVEGERSADEYASVLMKKMLNHPYYRIGKLIAGILSRFYFKRGVAAHWKGNFRRAASLHFRAYTINPENREAGQAYLQDRQAILTKTPSVLTDAERLWIYHRRVVSGGPQKT